MKKNILISFLIISLILSFSFYTNTAKAEESIPTVGGNDKKRCGPLAEWLGDCSTTSSIAMSIVKTLLNKLTDSIVNWINSGYSGSPSFVSDPATFFEDLALDEVANFISNNSDLQFLCSAFSVDIRLSLARKTSTYRKRSECTFNDIVRNVKGASININGNKVVSVDGIINGKFDSNGGWTSWLAMSQNSQNNIYGSFLDAQAELGMKVSGKQTQKASDLLQGKGFLSWSSCKTVASASVGGTGGASVSTGNTTTTKKCETKTPGSVVSSSLENSLGSEFRQLEIAQDFDQIMNAVASQLFSSLLSGGLSSGGSNSTSEATITATSQELESVNTLRTTTISQANTYLEKVNLYISNYQTALSYASGVRDLVQTVQTCYASSTYTTNNYYNDRYYYGYENRLISASEQVTQLQNTLNYSVYPVIYSLNAKILEYSSTTDALNNYITSAQESNNLDAIRAILNEMTNKYGYSIVAANGTETAASSAAYITTQAQLEPIKTEMWSSLRICQTSPNIRR